MLLTHRPYLGSIRTGAFGRLLWDKERHFTIVNNSSCMCLSWTHTAYGDVDHYYAFRVSRVTSDVQFYCLIHYSVGGDWKFRRNRLFSRTMEYLLNKTDQRAARWWNFKICMTNIDSRFLSSRDVGSSLEKFNAKSLIIGVGPVLIVVKFDTHISPKKKSYY